MMPSHKTLLTTAIIAILLNGCGGGGGSSPEPVVMAPPADATGDSDVTDPVQEDADAGISGSGQRSLGIITQFGSIYVNGVEYETDEAEIFKDGEPATEADLGVGMVVFVDGTVNDDGVTGTAEVVIADDAVEGPISAILTNADGDSKQLTILGVDIIVERTATVFENTTFDSLALNDVVEVSGFPESGNNLRASRVEKKSVFTPGESSIEIKGVVANLTAEQFALGDYIVDYSGADITEVPGGVQEGMAVEVYGTLIDNLITARKVESERRLSDRIETDDDVKVEGTVSNYIDDSNFVINGVSIDASSARLKPSGLTIATGLVLEVEGVWNGSTLTASEVELRRGGVEIEAAVSAVNAEQNTLELRTGNSVVTVLITSKTLLDDDSGVVARLSIADISIGDFLEVEAYEQDGQLIATRVDRERADTPEDFEIQGPVEAFTPGSDITVLGTTYDVTSARFEADDNGALGIDAFFALLEIGSYVEIDVASTAPTVAREVELEDDKRLDGSDFDDDEDEDDKSSDDDGDSESDDSDDGDSDSDDDDDVDSDESDDNDLDSDDGGSDNDDFDSDESDDNDLDSDDGGSDNDDVDSDESDDNDLDSDDGGSDNNDVDSDESDDNDLDSDDGGSDNNDVDSDESDDNDLDSDDGGSDNDDFDSEDDALDGDDSDSDDADDASDDSTDS